MLLGLELVQGSLEYLLKIQWYRYKRVSITDTLEQEILCCRTPHEYLSHYSLIDLLSGAQLQRPSTLKVKQIKSLS